jgi:hypothetical protein
MDITKLIQPITFEAPPLGKVWIPVRTAGFLSWFEKARPPAGGATAPPSSARCWAGAARRARSAYAGRDRTDGGGRRTCRVRLRSLFRV